MLSLSNGGVRPPDLAGIFNRGGMAWDYPYSSKIALSVVLTGTMASADVLVRLWMRAQPLLEERMENPVFISLSDLNLTHHDFVSLSSTFHFGS